MVKAGVFVVARFSPAFADQGVWRPIVVVVGLTTMVAGGLRALRPFDLKQVLAFEHGLHQFLKTSHGALLDKLEKAKAMGKDAEAELTTAITSFKKSFA